MAESLEHKKLKYKAYQYLLNSGYGLARMEKCCKYHGIADAWGIKSDSFYTKIIEVKISRADFFSDKEKARGYKHAPRAEEIYYLCPKGMIQKEEVYENCGLLWYYEESGRLRSIKKAPFLKVTIGEKMRILMDFLEIKTIDGVQRKMTLVKEPYNNF